MSNLNVKLSMNGVEFWASARQASALQTLMETNKGGFASVRGYVNSDGQKADYTCLTRISTERLYERRIAALEALTLNDIAADIAASPKLQDLPFADLVAQWNDRKASEIASLQKTLNGEREGDARREAHDRCYCTVTQGVKVHFKTEKVDGKAEPVLVNGLPKVESIMLGVVEIKRDVLVESAPKKPVNSGVPVLLSNIMRKHLPKSTLYKSLSLKDDNFDSLAIGGKELCPADVSGDFT